MQFITTVGRNIQALYWKSHPAWTTIPRCVKMYFSLGSVKNRAGQDRAPVSRPTLQAIISFHHQHPKGPWGEQFRIWRFSTPPYKTCWEIFLPCFRSRYQKPSSYSLTNFRATRCFLQSCVVNKSSDSGLSCLNFCTKDSVLWVSEYWNTQSIHIWGIVNANGIQQH